MSGLSIVEARVRELESRLAIDQEIYDAQKQEISRLRGLLEGLLAALERSDYPTPKYIKQIMVETRARL